MVAHLASVMGMEMTMIDWSEGQWTHEPVRVEQAADGLHVEAVEGSDAWRLTSYGFVHADEHALLAPMPATGAVEVDFVAAFEAQFDQAGLFLCIDDEHWVKAGVEFADGVPQLGAVVTSGHSDWSVAPVPDWVGRTVTIRASREGNAVTLRARVEGEDFRLVRVLPLPEDAEVLAGPLVCAPTRAGLVVHFTRWATGPQDASLHP